MEDSKPQLNLLQYTTLIYAFLTFLGYSYIDTYYSRWNIEIYPLLDASEIIFAIINNLNYLTSISVISTLLYMLSTQIIHPNIMVTHMKQIKIKYNLTAISETIIHYIYLLLIYFVTIGLFYIIYLIDRNEYLLIFVIINFSIIMLSIELYFTTIPDFFDSFNIQVNKYYLKIVLISVFVYLTNINSANLRFSYIEHKIYVNTFSFNYENKKYKSNDSLLYIGSTSKYLFIRNKINNTNLIFEKVNVKNLSLTTNK